MAEQAKWYVVHTYSGYENKVKANIEKSVENRGIGNLIQAVEVPMEDAIEKKGDEERVVKRKVFPGYVIVKMIMTDESWYVVRNTRGVTGFVGPASKPIPLTDKEVEKMGVEHVGFDMGIQIGDMVNIKSGPMEGFIGKVKSINPEKRTVEVIVSIFNRDTSVEIDYTQVEHTE